MRIVKIKKTEDMVFSYETFEKKLGISISNIVIKDDYLIVLEKHPSNRVFYLRCEDLKDILNVKKNLFSLELSTRGRSLVVLGEKREEVFKGAYKKWERK